MKSKSRIGCWFRLLMAQAACDAGVDPRILSFKHSVQLWAEWTARGPSSTNDRQRLFASIAQCLPLAQGASRTRSSTRHQVWSRVIFDVEDEIEARRDALIAALQKRLHRASRNQSLFVVRWSVI